MCEEKKSTPVPFTLGMNTYLKRDIWFALSMMCLLLTAQPAVAASFVCAKASSKIEHIICDTPEISKLDEELSAAYEAALQDRSNTTLIRQAQKQWMKERNGCTDAECIKHSYQTRIHQLPEIRGELFHTKNSEAGSNCSSVATKKYPPYPDVWHWELRPGSLNLPVNLFLLSNGDILAEKTLLFGGQTVTRGELVGANAQGDLVVANKKNVLSLNDGTEVCGVKEGGIFGRIKLPNGHEVVSDDTRHAKCYHGPIGHFLYVFDEGKGYVAKKVIFLIHDKSQRYMWDRPISPPGSDIEVDPCTEEGPPGYTTPIEAVSGVALFPLEDGTFLLPMRDGLIVRFDEHFNTKSPLLNRRFFVFDLNDSGLFIDKINGKKYDLRNTGYQPVYDDLYQYLTNIGRK